MYRYYSITPLLVFGLFVGLRSASLWVPEDYEPPQDSVEEQQLQDRVDRVRTRIMVKRDLLRQLSDKECSLAEAADQLAGLMEPENLTLLQRVYPAPTPQQSVALQLIQTLRVRSFDIERSDLMLQRLEKEFDEMKRRDGTSAATTSAI